MGQNFLKASSATSARATEAPRPTDRSSAKRRPTPTSADFALHGPSDPPDPQHHAYRKDLADVALAGRVIAPHYAEPLTRVLGVKASLRDTASDDAAAVIELQAGDAFDLLDD